ncbi:MAG: FHA domain-containing protein [Chloroflexi bacterium]|nr:FHA domain-containing protein [Chloroflexota bacterium]
MFFGRIDVYWPDGPIESYRLNKASVAIGRSTGNDIVLDTTAISRYHVKLIFQNQQALLEDLESVNGTYVENVRLLPHEPYGLRGGEEVQIGDILLIYHPPTGVETTTSTEAIESTQRITLAQTTYKVELEGPDMAVAPGAHGQAALKIENTGSDVDQYRIEIEGLPKGWARVDHTEIEIDPGEQHQAIISFKPLRRSETKPGEYPLTVRVRSKSHPNEAIELPTVLHILSFSGFGMALNNLHTGSGGHFTLYLHNQGNASLPIGIQGNDSGQELVFDLPHNPLPLGPGERRTITGSVRLRRRRWFGVEHEHEFALVARAQDPSGFMASVPGIYAEKGLLPGWLPVLIVPALALLVLLFVGAILLALSAGNDENPNTQPPVINGFAASIPVVAIGETAIINWQITYADALEVVVDRAGVQQRHTIDATQTTFPLVFDQTGHYTVTLEAHHKDAVSTAELTLDVQPLATFDLQILNGLELVRNVQSDVRMIWNVTGANTLEGAYHLWFERSDQTAPLLPAPLPQAGQQDFQIVVEEGQTEWLVTLYAQGQDGLIASQTKKFTPVYPICELRAEKTLVREGPDERYMAILPPQPPDGSPDGTLSYSPLARDPSGQWLKISVSIGEKPGWVKLDDFECTNFDPARLIVTSDYPPLPQTTPLPTTSPESTQPPTPAASTPTPRSNIPLQWLGV